MNNDQLVHSNVWWQWTMTLRLMNWDSSSDWWSNDLLWRVYLVWSCTKQFMNRCTCRNFNWTLCSLCCSFLLQLYYQNSYASVLHDPTQNDKKWIVQYAMASALSVEKWNSVLQLTQHIIVQLHVCVRQHSCVRAEKRKVGEFEYLSAQNC